MNKRSRGHAKRGLRRSEAAPDFARLPSYYRRAPATDAIAVSFFTTELLDSSAPTLIRDARRELQSNRTITSHIHHPFERSRTPPPQTSPLSSALFLGRVAPCATTKTFFLRVFLVYNDERRARRSFVSPLPRVVGSHPASPFLSPRRSTSKMTARFLAASPSSASALAHRRRGLGSRRAFFSFSFFTRGYSPRGFRRRRPSPPGAAPRTNTGLRAAIRSSRSRIPRAYTSPDRPS